VRWHLTAGSSAVDDQPHAPATSATTVAGRAVVAVAADVVEGVGRPQHQAGGDPGQREQPRCPPPGHDDTTAAPNAAATATTAAGTATTLAGTEASGTSPKVPAAGARPRAAHRRSPPGPPRAGAAAGAGGRGRRGASTSTPAAALADSSSPATPPASGRRRTSSSTATDQPVPGVPRHAPRARQQDHQPHRPGTEHRRFEPGQERERRRGRRGAPPTAAGPDAAAAPSPEDPTTRIGDVGARHGREVREPRRRMASASASGSRRVSPVTKPGEQPPEPVGLPRGRRRADTLAHVLARAEHVTPGRPTASQRGASSTTVACWRAIQRP
jgi:hypothetical protein